MPEGSTVGAAHTTTGHMKSAPSTPAAGDVVRPLVFISHDHADAPLAEAFGCLITDTCAGAVECFQSSALRTEAGQEYGDDWYKGILAKLRAATYVVALLTKGSVERPWILFEVGVARGMAVLGEPVQKKVVGIALGVSMAEASRGPFGRFLNCGDGEDELVKFVLEIAGSHPHIKPGEDRVRSCVKEFLAVIHAHVPAEQPDDAESDRLVSLERSMDRFGRTLDAMADRIEGSLRGQEAWRQQAETLETLSQAAMRSALEERAPPNTDTLARLAERLVAQSARRKLSEVPTPDWSEVLQEDAEDASPPSVGPG